MKSEIKGVACNEESCTILAEKDDKGYCYDLGDYTVHDTPKKWAETGTTVVQDARKVNLIIGENENGRRLDRNSYIKTVE